MYTDCITITKIFPGYSKDNQCPNISGSQCFYQCPSQVIDPLCNQIISNVTHLLQMLFNIAEYRKRYIQLPLQLTYNPPSIDPISYWEWIINIPAALIHGIYLIIFGICIWWTLMEDHLILLIIYIALYLGLTYHNDVYRILLSTISSILSKFRLRV